MNDFFLLISRAFASLFSANWGGVERTVVVSKLLMCLIVFQTPVYPKLSRLLPVAQLALSPSSKALGLEQPLLSPHPDLPGLTGHLWRAPLWNSIHQTFLASTVP